MKLPDFSADLRFISLLRAMGIANPEPWESGVCLFGGSRISAPVLAQLSLAGIEVRIEEVEEAPDRTLTYEGQKVAVYIRDQYLRFLRRGNEYKFHIAECDTLKKMRAQRRFETRYVVTNRRDGIFLVNYMDDAAQVAEKSREVRLHVCKRCLLRLNYQGYANTSQGKQGAIYHSFSLNDFFAQYSSTIGTKPPHDAYSMPINTYPKDWSVISATARQRANWTCQECGLSLEDYRDLLHTHHIDRNKSNNISNNLKVLCVICHRNVPGHEELKQHPSYWRCREIKDGRR